jgi:hypothetical protein
MNRYRFLDEKGEHMHTLDNRPLIGTSSVSSVLSKPLAWYGSGRAVMEFGVPDPKVLTKIKNKKATQEEIYTLEQAMIAARFNIAQLSDDEYLKLCDKAYRAHDSYKRERADTGTDTHAICEEFILRFLDIGPPAINEKWPDEIKPFVQWTSDNGAWFIWTEGHCYSEKYWLGGISDCGVILGDSRRGILDFKSSREAYTEQFWQCAGYAIQIEENGILDPQGNQILPPQKPFDFVAVLPFGAKKPEVHMDTNVQYAKKGFLAEFELYKLLPRPL